MPIVAARRAPFHISFSFQKVGLRSPRDSWAAFGIFWPYRGSILAAGQQLIGRELAAFDGPWAAHWPGIGNILAAPRGEVIVPLACWRPRTAKAQRRQGRSRGQACAGAPRLEVHDEKDRQTKFHFAIFWFRRQPVWTQPRRQPAEGWHARVARSAPMITVPAPPDPSPVKSSFPPVVDRNTRLLILGSLPGEASLLRGEYYAHPRNHFWRLMEGVIEVRRPALPRRPSPPAAPRTLSRSRGRRRHGSGFWEKDECEDDSRRF